MDDCGRNVMVCHDPFTFQRNFTRFSGLDCLSSLSLLNHLIPPFSGHPSRPFLMTKFWQTLGCHFIKSARITKSYHCSISLISALLSNMMFSCHIIDYDNRVLWGWAGWRT
ncbi:hypothetical protein C8J56DRAFT_1025932 [Mycena floridula]|nr:hypothetical protein C8J56DRAFT_1025932 [Mycena floridula]